MSNCKNQRFGHNFREVGEECSNCGILQSQLSRPVVSKKERKYAKENEEFQQHKADYSFQELGIIMAQQFKENIWWIFHKYSEDKIRRAFKVCQEKGVYKLRFLLGVLRRL